MTATLNIQKHEPPISLSLAGDVSGPFPGFIPRTDEPRLQSNPALLEELATTFLGTPFYITQKMDGTSCTIFYHDGEFVVVTGKQKDSSTSHYWNVIKKYSLHETLFEYCQEHDLSMVNQGEICGPGIQKNPVGLKETCFFAFNAYNIREGAYLDLQPFLDLISSLNTVTVPFIDSNTTFGSSSCNIDYFLNLSIGRYPSGKPQEGISIRPRVEENFEALSGRLSFKAVNDRYLLSVEE